VSAPDLAAYARNGFLVLEGFLPEADCDALQARAAELVAGFGAGAARTVFSARDQLHARDRYFRESGGAIRFFFEEDPIRIIAHTPNPTHQKSDVLNIVSLEFTGGRAASILLDRLCKGPERYLDLRLDGEFGTVTTSIGGELAVEAGLRTRERRPYFAFNFTKGGKAVWQNGNRSRVLAKEEINPFAHATAVHLQNFIDALARNRTPLGAARDHRKTLALVFAAYDAAAAGCSVELAPYLASAAVSNAVQS